MQYTVTIILEGNKYETELHQDSRDILKDVRALLEQNTWWDILVVDVLPLTSPPPHQVSSPTGGV